MRTETKASPAAVAWRPESRAADEFVTGFAANRDLAARPSKGGTWQRRTWSASRARVIHSVTMFERVDAFVRNVAAVETEVDLSSLIFDVARELGFSFFALTHHVDTSPQSQSAAIRLHNYPREWEAYFEEKRLGRSDPVHRASQLTTIGFRWVQLPAMIDLTGRDREILGEAARHGIGDGFTVPAHVPGDINGSCSFATEFGRELHVDHLATAQLIGAFSFEAARRLARQRGLAPRGMPHVSDRQRDCLIWVARGKSDFEIATILGISPETVHQYVKQARAAFDVVSRSQLVAEALFDGTISFLDIHGR